METHDSPRSGVERMAIPLADAAHRRDMTPEGMKRAVKRGDPEGYQDESSGLWFVFVDSVERFQRRPRRAPSAQPTSETPTAHVLADNVALREANLQLLAASEEDRKARDHLAKALEFAARALAEMAQSEASGSRAQGHLEAALLQWNTPGSPADMPTHR